MKVKRYVVNALPEALPMIRSELGLDAVILNTKEIRVGGFLGMFGKKKTEVIAAVETNGAGNAQAGCQTVGAIGEAALSPEAAATMAATLSAAVAGREKQTAAPARQAARPCRAGCRCAGTGSGDRTGRNIHGSHGASAERVRRPIVKEPSLPDGISDRIGNAGSAQSADIRRYADG